MMETFGSATNEISSFAASPRTSPLLEKWYGNPIWCMTRPFSFNGRMRDELLNETMFRNLIHARVVIAAWVTDYNTERPHSALDYQTPADYARTLTTAIVRPAARDDGSARRTIAQPAPIGVNTNRTQVAAG